MKLGIKKNEISIDFYLDILKISEKMDLSFNN